jgi:hypothetical protein
MLIVADGSKKLEIYNPFLAHSAATAATVFLQQSFTGDARIRAAKQDGFRKCLGFVKSLGRHWPHAEQLVSEQWLVSSCPLRRVELTKSYRQ